MTSVAAQSTLSSTAQHHPINLRPTPSPRRHSFTDKSPTVATFLAYGGIEEENHPASVSSYVSGTVLEQDPSTSTFFRPRITPFQLGPAPAKIPTSRLRASSYSSPNFSLPTSDTTRLGPPQFARRIMSSTEASFSEGLLPRVADEEELSPESPMDKMPFQERERESRTEERRRSMHAGQERSTSRPSKPTSPLPPLPTELAGEPEPHPSLSTYSSTSSLPTYSTPLSTPEGPSRTLSSNRQLSSAALAAVADTPPRPSSSSRPLPPPPKSAARMSAGSTMSETEPSTSTARVRSASSASKSASRERRFSSRTSSPPPAPVLNAVTPINGLVDPRPRNPSTRTTPALSQAGSSSSRASSSVFTPSSSAIARNSGFSGEGTDWRRTSMSGSDFGKDDLASGLEDEGGYSRSKPMLSHLRVDVDKAETANLGLGLGGLGIEGLDGHFPVSPLGDGDFQKGLDELSRYAQTLPSPLPPSEVNEKGWSPRDRDPDKTLKLGNLRTVQDAPISLTTSISRSNSNSSIPPQRPPLHPRHSSLSGSSKVVPITSHKRKSTNDSTDVADSDAYLSVDESGIDDLTTDDEGDTNRRRFLPYGEADSNFLFHQSSATSAGEYWDDALGGEEVLSERVTKNVSDYSGRSLEAIEIDLTTTHLLLSKSHSPELVPGILMHTLPMLGFRLVVLDIAHCGLTDLPFELASCPRLQELDIRGNQFVALPPVLGNLISLRVLIADDCGLSTLPNFLAPLRYLHTLSVRNNALRQLPSWLCRLTSLDILLLDGNDFIWHWADLVKPLLRNGAAPLEPSESPLEYAPNSAPFSARSSVTGSLPTLAERHSNPTTPEMKQASEFATPVGAESLTRQSSLASSIPSPAFSGSASPASGHSMSTPPPMPSPHIDLAEAQARLRHHSDKPRSQATSPMPESPAPSNESSKKWGKMFKKASSINKIRPSTVLSPNPSGPSRPGGLAEGARTFSQPITNEESNVATQAQSLKVAANIFTRTRALSRPKAMPTPLSLREEERKLVNRQSFLKLEEVPSLDMMINGAASITSSTTAFSTMQSELERRSALNSLTAYLRDLDDLMDHAAPSPNPPSSATFGTSPSASTSSNFPSFNSPSLRTSPSLGSLSPSAAASAAASIRRAQSSRRLPTRSIRAEMSPFATHYGEDDSSGRTTPLANSSGGQPTNIRVDVAKRDMIVKEILSTEKSYIRGLKELCDIYVVAASVPVSSSSGKSDTVVPSAERRAVFGNIEGILSFHETAFLPDILEALGRSPSKMTPEESAAAAVAISQVFIKHMAFFKIYSVYVNAFDSALNRLQAWNIASRPLTSSGSRPGTGGANGSRPPPPLGSVSFDASMSVPSLSSSEKKRIRSYLKRCRAHPRHTQINLESYLLLPVQRVPRYRMLLENLLACTPADVDSIPLQAHPVIQEALDKIAGMATDMNEKKRESEGRQQLLYWQNRIGNNFRSPLVQPHRSLLKSGTVTLIRTVKKSSVLVEAGPRGGVVSESGKAVQVHSLHQEIQQKNLIALLCNDMLVFVIQPADPNDTVGPVELFTVMRLGGSKMRGRPAPVSLFGGEGTILRIHCDSRAILYVQCPSRSEAKGWLSAINVQQELTSG